MPKKAAKKRPKFVKLHVKHRFGLRWDGEGRAYGFEDYEPEERRPEYDFGTPAGDVLIDPWIQKLLAEPK